MRLRPREPSLILLTWALVGVTRAIALNILCGGDDSWGTANIRALYYHLRAAGHAVVIAAPALQQSGTRGTIRPATPLVHDGEFGLVKKGAPAEGHDVHDGEQSGSTWSDGWPANGSPYRVDDE